MTNHNHAPNTEAEFTPAEAQVLSIQVIDEWRTQQFKSMHELGERSGWNGDMSEGSDYGYSDSINQSITDFLASKGIDESSAHYAEIKGLFLSVTPGRDDAGFISDRSWHARNDDGISKRDEMQALMESMNAHGSSEAQDSDGSEDPTSDNGDQFDEALAMNQEFDELNEKLAEARSKWAKASSKRLGRAFSIKDTDRAKLKKEYEELVRERGRWALDNNVLQNEDRELYANPTEQERDDMLEGERLYKRGRNDVVIEYLFEEQEKLRTEIIENLQGTKVSRFVQWMNKGSVAQRVAKGVTLGVLAGVGGGLLAGAAGAGIVAAGAVGASRFVKGYAAKDRKRGSKMHTAFTDADVDTFKHSTDTSVVLNVDESHGTVNNYLEEDVKNEQKERRKALVVGAGSVALGAGLGFAVTEISGKSGIIGEKIQGLWDDNAKDLTPGADDATSGDIYPNTDYDNDGIPNDQDVAPRNPNIGAIDFNELSDNARWIEAGEGGFQTLKELGIPEAKWEAIWADAGEAFAEDGKTYLMDDGRYGWSQPGRLSNADILELARAARRNGVVLDMALAA